MENRLVNSPDSGNWRREPLLHFLLIGAALFALNAWLDQRSTGHGSIVLSESHVRVLVENFRRTWQRPPSEQELDGLIEEQIRDEVLTREAMRLGLERDDTVIRRRLRQKLEIITEEAAASIAPTEAQLQAYLDAHAEDFRGEARVAFAQVYFDPNKRGEALDADIKRVLAQLNGQSDSNAPTAPTAAAATTADTAATAQNTPDRRSTSTDFERMGDRLFVLKAQYPLTGQRELAAVFGSEFAQALPGLPRGQWRGPVDSGYGVHLVRMDAHEAAPVATLADVRPLVEREWRNAQRKEAAAAQYQRLRAGYQIVVRRPSSGKSQ
jgi:hypothetical protein